MNRLIYNTTTFGGRQKPGKFYTPDAARQFMRLRYMIIYLLSKTLLSKTLLSKTNILQIANNVN